MCGAWNADASLAASLFWQYLEAATGYTAAAGEFSPVARAAGRFLLQLWYYGENADTDKLQRVIDCLLKALSAERAKA